MDGEGASRNIKGARVGAYRISSNELGSHPSLFFIDLDGLANNRVLLHSVNMSR